MHFVETMRGQLTDAATQAVHEVCFHVRAERQHGGLFSLTGVLHGAPWAEEVVSGGTMVMGALPPSITYDVRFSGRDGRALRIFGSKYPTPRAPFESMAHLTCVLQDADTRAELAHGYLRFDLLDLPKFLASWLPGRSMEHRRLEAQHQAVLRRSLLGG